jgi:CMP-N-acetylneuraminic acid synthetase
MFEQIVAVIPVRLNSSRVKKKVLQEIKPGVSLIENKIIQLKEVLPAKNIIVNSESEELLEIASTHGVTCMMRDPYYSDGHKTTFSDVIMEVISDIQAEHIAWAPCVVPFFDSEVFEKSFTNYSENVINGEYDSLVSVTSFKEYLWDNNGPLNYKATKEHTVSQDLPGWHVVTNGNYMAPKSVMMAKKYFLGDKVFLDTVPDKCSIDIDTYHDLKLAKAYSGLY